MFEFDGELAFRLLLGALVVGAIVYVVRPRYAFTVLIQAGTVRTTQGHAPREFLRDLQTACSAAGVADGRVDGVVRGKRVVLSFSPSIPAQCRQQLRNVWQLRQFS